MDRRKFLKAGLFAAPASAALSLKSANATGNSHHNNAVSQQPELKITWLGSATLLIQFNGFTILTDPCFGTGDKAFKMGNPNEMFDLAKGPNVIHHKRISGAPQITELSFDQIILSHGHEDHFDQNAQNNLKKSIPFILPPHDREKVAAAGFNKLDTLDWYETRTIELDNSSIKISAIPAYHSENPQIAEILGKGNGYYFEFLQADWKRSLYWTGDTFGTQAVVDTLKAFDKPDLMVPHMGGVGTTGPLGKISMEAEDLLPFVEKVTPKKVLPIHHSTYELYLEKISKLAQKNDDHLFEMDLISEGSTLSIT